MFWIGGGGGVVLGKRRFIFVQMKSMGIILHVEWLLGCQKGGLKLLSLPNNVWRLIVFAPFLIIIIIIILSFRAP